MTFLWAFGSIWGRERKTTTSQNAFRHDDAVQIEQVKLCGNNISRIIGLKTEIAGYFSCCMCALVIVVVVAFYTIALLHWTKVRASSFVIAKSLW